ncbi:hypothetical protein ABFS82_10G102700 [Erythranthe guttata]|nr:PREDICTED: protein cfxQ homolog [Erythranthe guttata]|eukprot:XP_012849477.1 PREDICTED: protein cfxQ homolog [Erythranthe guttata]
MNSNVISLEKKLKRIKMTLHHIYARNNSVDDLKNLLDSWKAALEATNAKGETPLHVAAKNGCNEAAKMLLDYGACVDATTDKSETPLHFAADYAQISGKISIVNTLLKYKADRSAKDSNGRTALHYLRVGNQELKKLLDQDNVAIKQIALANNSNPVIDNGSGMKRTAYDEKMDVFEDELSKIVGLDKLKLRLRTWAKGMLMDKMRRAAGINLGPRKPPHMVFLGNPGTGKTTVARSLGKILQSVGVLSSDKVTEVQRTDLVGKYIGQTGPTTRKKIEEAMGGILLVDEAYRLAPVRSSGNSQDFGMEALEEIMSVLEDGNIVVIFAGYTEPMKRVFSSNEGFCRRVTHFFHFDDFSCKDLAEMVMIKMSKQAKKSRLYGFKLHSSCTWDAVLQVIENNSTEKIRNKLNGGLVDHMLNNARENLDLRLTFDSKGDELSTITLSDLEAGLKMLSDGVNVD